VHLLHLIVHQAQMYVLEDGLNTHPFDVQHLAAMSPQTTHTMVFSTTTCMRVAIGGMNPHASITTVARITTLIRVPHGALINSIYPRAHVVEGARVDVVVTRVIEALAIDQTLDKSGKQYSL
jgi:hypothetical protein